MTESACIGDTVKYGKRRGRVTERVTLYGNPELVHLCVAFRDHTSGWVPATDTRVVKRARRKKHR